MSRDFFLRCVTCDPPKPGVRWDSQSCWGAGSDLNHKGDELLALLPHLPLFAAVARAGFDIAGDSLGLTARDHSCRAIGEFARAHADHDVRVWDEYGSEWPQRLRARVVDRRLVAYPSQGAESVWPTPVDVLECGHEVEVDPRFALPRTDGYHGRRYCPVCVEPRG